MDSCITSATAEMTMTMTMTISLTMTMTNIAAPQGGRWGVWGEFYRRYKDAVDVCFAV